MRYTYPKGTSSLAVRKAHCRSTRAGIAQLYSILLVLDRVGHARVQQEKERLNFNLGTSTRNEK